VKGAAVLEYAPHSRDALVPALDHPPGTKFKHDRVPTVQAAVKLGPVYQFALQACKTRATI
jgi:hypothetical protein